MSNQYEHVYQSRIKSGDAQPRKKIDPSQGPQDQFVIGSPAESAAQSMLDEEQAAEKRYEKQKSRSQEAPK